MHKQEIDSRIAAVLIKYAGLPVCPVTLKSLSEEVAVAFEDLEVTTEEINYIGTRTTQFLGRKI